LEFLFQRVRLVDLAGGFSSDYSSHQHQQTGSSRFAVDQLPLDKVIRPTQEGIQVDGVDETVVEELEETLDLIAGGLHG